MLDRPGLERIQVCSPDFTSIDPHLCYNDTTREEVAKKGSQESASSCQGRNSGLWTRIHGRIAQHVAKTASRRQRRMRPVRRATAHAVSGAVAVPRERDETRHAWATFVASHARSLIRDVTEALLAEMQAATHAHHGRAMAKSLPDSWAALAWALWSLTTSRCAGAAIQIGLWTRASSGWESPRCQDPGLSRWGPGACLSKPSTTDPEAHKLPNRAAVSFGTKAYEYARQMAGSPGLIEVYNMTTGWTASRLESLGVAQAASDETGQPDDRLAPTFRIHEHESDAMESSVIVRADTSSMPSTAPRRSPLAPPDSRLEWMDDEQGCWRRGRRSYRHRVGPSATTRHPQDPGVCGEAAGKASARRRRRVEGSMGGASI
ncbi:hypothetical protein Purlil1_1460 [Purpureocillium lilacinum]|uniref:Uncharacterized protein n=1 Tax=Purpureocillium lilacinum TaxID=33203 RepID=A0ABR0CCQ9_PURLI|nr:hypothetical protein Purlil1_1460 [Purpureocillium lilacinum]